MAAQLETERKFALEPAQELPPLDAVAMPGPVQQVDLVATYYDAPDYRLTRARLVLRRREGGHDEGWHVKLPGDGPDERHELHVPLGSRRPPQELRALVAETLGEAPLVPVAVLRTHRREQELLAPDGDVLALVTIDDVEATVGDDGRSWREAEVELVSGDPTLLDQVEARLAADGIHRAVSASKIAQALQRAIAASAAGDEHSAGAAVHAFVRRQVGVLQALEAAVRSDGEDAVHRSRVATRRLRSTLKTYAGVLPSSAQALRDELRWYAKALGAARDAEVLRDRIADAVDQLPHKAGRAVRGRIASSLDDAHAVAHSELVKSMATKRYERLQLDLEQFVAAADVEWVAEEPAAVALPPMLGQAVRRVRRLARTAAAHPGDLARWHEVRKAAKAARYGAELLVPAMDEVADAWRAKWEAVTEAFGAVQDCVVAQEVIDELAAAARAEGRPQRPFEELRAGQDAALRDALLRGREALAIALQHADPGEVG